MAYASVIAQSAVIRGNVRGDTSLEILGRVEGDVGITGDLSLGPDAVVVGTISGARVVIGGSVEGDVTGTEAVVVEDTGRVVGNLSAPRIGMSEGAEVQGSVRTSAPSRSAARASSSEARESRAEARESRAAASPPVDRARPVAATPSPAPVAAAKPPVALAKRLPPPPVITAPRPGVRARKKVARR
jgi:cytoskeletal protein CcmA (bactofilin family)